MRQLDPRIFVFGSNLAGRHGAGAAAYARRYHGAVYGVGVGLTGRSYAVPTKDLRLRTLPLGVISDHIGWFLSFARSRPDLRFLITPVGCGLAGYSQREIRPMFFDAPQNCDFADTWDAGVLNATA